MTTVTDNQLLQATFDEVGRLKEELTGVKLDVQELREDMNSKFAESNQKLDKILEVVTKNFAKQAKQIKRLEDHVGLPAIQ